MKISSNIDQCGAPKFATASEASGDDTVLTIAADAGEFWVIDWVSWSYGSGLVAADGNLTISIGGTVVWQADITVSGPGHIEFTKPIYGAKGEAVVITLSDGTTAGKLNVRYR